MTALSFPGVLLNSLMPQKIQRQPTSPIQPATMGVPPTVTFSAVGAASSITSAVALPYNTSLVRLLGCVPLLTTSLGTNYYFNNINASDAPTPFAAEFDHYGPTFEIRYDNFAGAPQFWVWVDGVPASAAPVAGPTNNTGSYFQIKVDFGTAAWRRVRVYMIFAHWGGMFIGPTDTIAPTSEPRPRLAWLGDSWAGGAATMTSNLHTIPQMLTRVMAYQSPFVGAQGGTGWVANPGGAKAVMGNAARLSAIIAAAPDIVVTQGSINDDASFASVQAAVAPALATLKAGLPYARFVALGVQALSGSPPANRVSNNTAFFAGVDQVFSAGSIVKIDPITDGWITGTGRVGLLSGVGNADIFIGSDATHYTDLGGEYYARKIAAVMSSDFATLH